jgi:hypothetical protein
MAKRFTDSEKWNDKWYRTLSPSFKHAWGYMLDCCDHAGVFERDDELATFRIGCEVDWDSFIEACGHRVLPLGDGKLFIVGFVAFQYGVISEACKAHNPVFTSLRRHGLEERVLKGYPKGIQGDQDKDKDKDKAKTKKEKGVPAVADDEWEIPEPLDAPEVRSLLDDFEAMRKRIGAPVRSRRSTSKVFKHFDSVEHLVFALETCIANDYRGLKADYRPVAKSSRGSDRGGRHRDPRGNLALLDEINREGTQNGV